MPVPDSVVELIETFRNNSADYLKTTFNEHQTRVQFINPLWNALGWDIENKAGYAEGFKDVLHEASLKIGGSSKAPDYSFGIATARKFFLEAKKPSVNLEAEQDPSYQVRRYAFSAKFSLSVLTNFRQLAVYDGKIAPQRADKPTIARLKLYSLDDYIEKWDEIYALLSREAVLKGAFDRFAETKTKRGTTPVDTLFLREIEGWRQSLAQEIASKNNLSAEELNLSVGRIIDRIIFLRICEENGIEPGHPLLALKGGVNTYARMCELFRRADERYNSGLFHFDPSSKRREAADETTQSLQISNKAIKDILARLYYPETPYAFDYLPLDVLGQIYERFLGKVITLKGKKAEVEEKPAVRKAGGVYYTPAYIVNYIVAQTLGRALEGKTPADTAKIKVLDPACGSGSFLLGAYDYLLKWHLEWYRANDPESHAKRANPPIYQSQNPDPTAVGPLYRLTSRERKRIALDHLFGVDLDAQAVEVTKLSLVLKVLEGETAENIDLALKNHKERALPDLGDNIKCGNSLIGPDFYSPKDPSEWQRRNDLSEAERRKLNDFNWKTEFPTIMKAGGFDVVIGNPPYIQLSMQEFRDDEVNSYLKERYDMAAGRLNTFILFFERAREICRENGFTSFIIPNTITSQEYYEEARLRLLNNHIIKNIASAEGELFKDAVVETVVLVCQKRRVEDKSILDNEVVFGKVNEEGFEPMGVPVKQSELHKNHRTAFAFPQNQDIEAMKLRIELNRVKFGDLMNVNQAIALKSDRAAALSQTQETKQYREMLDGRHINRYFTGTSPNFFKFDLTKIHSCRREDIFLLKEKILFRRVGDGLIASLDINQKFALNTLFVVSAKTGCDYSLKFVLGIFNSHLMNYYFGKFLKSKKTVFSEIQARQIAQLPLPKLDLADKADKQSHDRMVTLVTSMLQLQKDVRAASGGDKTKLEKRIATTDSQIDALAYELYGLSEAEITLVEGT